MTESPVIIANLGPGLREMALLLSSNFSRFSVNLNTVANLNPIL